MTAATASTPPSPGRRLSPVDVAVNLLWCVPGDVGGSEQYLVRQLIGLASQPAEFVPTLYCLPAFVDAHPELAELFSLVVAGISGDERPRRVLAEYTWLRRRTRSADLVHHGGGTTPLVGRRPIVLTIHDLQYLTHPEYLKSLKQHLKPTGNGLFTHDGTYFILNVELNGIYSADLGAYHLDANLSVTRLGIADAGESRNQYGWAAAVSRPVNDTWGVAVELAGSTRRGADDTAQLLGALSYNWSKHVVLDVGAAFGLNKATPDTTVFAGAVVLLK